MVDQDFKIPKPDIGNEATTTINPVRGVSYYEHEVILNDNKRNISILRPEYLQQFLIDIKNEMTYKRSSQFVNNRLIKTENTRVTN